MKPEKEKTAYEKPRLRTIELAVEEVMGVGCKMPSGPGPVSGTCTVGPKCSTPAQS